jgi:hypothetical protein
MTPYLPNMLELSATVTMATYFEVVEPNSNVRIVKFDKILCQGLYRGIP